MGTVIRELDDQERKVKKVTRAGFHHLQVLLSALTLLVGQQERHMSAKPDSTCPKGSL